MVLLPRAYRCDQVGMLGIKLVRASAVLSFSFFEVRHPALAATTSVLEMPKFFLYFKYRSVFIIGTYVMSHVRCL